MCDVRRASERVYFGDLIVFRERFRTSSNTENNTTNFKVCTKFIFNNIKNLKKYCTVAEGSFFDQNYFTVSG